MSLRMQSLALALLMSRGRAVGQMGDPKCQCIGTDLKGDFATKQHSCDYTFAIDGKCMVSQKFTDDPGVNWSTFAGDYGQTCKAHVEYQSGSCSDLSTVPPTPKVHGKATWCDSPWCYVDQCNCESPDIKKSDYFNLKNGEELYYSYGTCAGTNTYCSESQTANCVSTDVGNENCAGDVADAAFAPAIGVASFFAFAVVVSRA